MTDTTARPRRWVVTGALLDTGEQPAQPEAGGGHLLPAAFVGQDERVRLILHLGGLRAELIHPPVPAHTTNDTVVWVPERRVLVTGDVVMSATW
ncbi:hypothetical protein [Nonomuraea sp. NPDC049309]|uniref:hypothetical protein n=1 Tax=Nonomuraea sp. NPDC049309 TaxID=3364350 RepID=UPI003722AED3